MKIKCEFCGEEFDRSPSHIREHNFCSISCSSKWHYQEGFNLGFKKGHGNFDGSEKGWFTTERASGENNVNYTDGSYYGKGYPVEFKRMRKMLLSKNIQCCVCKDFIFEQTPSRHLCVHHKDENIQNNQLNNLLVMCNSCHQKLHRELEGLRRL